MNKKQKYYLTKISKCFLQIKIQPLLSLKKKIVQQKSTLLIKIQQTMKKYKLKIKIKQQQIVQSITKQALETK